MQALKTAPISLEEYIAIEKLENTRYEFHDGHIYAMAGGSFNHSIIGANVIRAIGSKLVAKGSPCFPSNSDLKLHIQPGNRYLYPDAMILCGDVEKSPSHKEAVINPVVIIEVLSDSTAGYDRGDKFHFYRQIENLKEYVLVEQDKAQIETYTRTEDGFWKIDRITGLESKVMLESIGVELELAEAYRNVNFETEKA